MAEVGEHLVTQLRTLLDELGVLGDPEAAAAQIESVTTEAGEQVAAATARAARAERAARSAEAEREQADTAAEEALARLEEVSAELEQTRQAWQTEVGALTVAQAELIRITRSPSRRLPPPRRLSARSCRRSIAGPFPGPPRNAPS